MAVDYGPSDESVALDEVNKHLATLVEIAKRVETKLNKIDAELDVLRRHPAARMMGIR